MARTVEELRKKGDVFACYEHEEDDPSGALHAEELLSTDK
jgi:hypothetical protein